MQARSKGGGGGGGGGVKKPNKNVFCCNTLYTSQEVKNNPANDLKLPDDRDNIMENNPRDHIVMKLSLCIELHYYYLRKSCDL